MNILIPDSWLRKYLSTKAGPRDISKYLTLYGPSVEKLEKIKNDYIYHIEITTNRIDAVGIYGIAREASAILPRFKIAANFKKILPEKKYKYCPKVKYLDVKIDHKLCYRFTAVLIKDVKIKPSSKKIKERLEKVGVRPINNIVDISNYIMHEFGQPIHTFDYDKIKGAKMHLRASKKGEKITTLDGKTYVLAGGDIVIEDGDKRLIDLAGIMGGQNSSVDKNTKNVLLFIQTYNPSNIRKTSMSLAQRTEAAEIFEKDIDPELVQTAMDKSIPLFEELTQGNIEKEILDLYPNPYKEKIIKTNLDFIQDRIGIAISKNEISKTLKPLGFSISWSKNALSVGVPSFRSKDINIAEDIIEEISRIYGYHNLPSKLMKGSLPKPMLDAPFDFEYMLKQILKSYGGIEIYSSSLVPKDFVRIDALKLSNPLGEESEYLRTSLMPSLIQASSINASHRKDYHLFEIANIYLPRKNNIPNEAVTLAGIFSNTSYRKAKGVVEVLLDELNIKYKIKQSDSKSFSPSKKIDIYSKGELLGMFGVLEDEINIYYEFNVEKLRKVYKKVSSYKKIPKYPAQIEDLTLIMPERTRVGDVLTEIKFLSKEIAKVSLRNIYNNSYTFRVWYQHAGKTLTNSEVKKIRNLVIRVLKQKFGATIVN